MRAISIFVVLMIIFSPVEGQTSTSPTTSCDGDICQQQQTETCTCPNSPSGCSCTIAIGLLQTQNVKLISSNLKVNIRCRGQNSTTSVYSVLFAGREFKIDAMRQCGGSCTDMIEALNQQLNISTQQLSTIRVEIKSGSDPTGCSQSQNLESTMIVNTVYQTKSSSGGVSVQFLVIGMVCWIGIISLPFIAMRYCRSCMVQRYAGTHETVEVVEYSANRQLVEVRERKFRLVKEEDFTEEHRTLLEEYGWNVCNCHEALKCRTSVLFAVVDYMRRNVNLKKGKHKERGRNAKIQRNEARKSSHSKELVMQLEDGFLIVSFATPKTEFKCIKELRDVVVEDCPILITLPEEIKYSDGVTGEIAVDDEGRVKRWKGSRESHQFKRKVEKLLEELEKLRSSSVGCVEEDLLLRLSRSRCFDETVIFFNSVSGIEILRKMRIEFEGEEGTDCGGVRREWVHLISFEMISPEQKLFASNKDYEFDVRPQLESGEDSIIPAWKKIEISSSATRAKLLAVGKFLGKCVAMRELLSFSVSRRLCEDILMFAKQPDAAQGASLQQKAQPVVISQRHPSVSCTDDEQLMWNEEKERVKPDLVSLLISGDEGLRQTSPTPLENSSEIHSGEENSDERGRQALTRQSSWISFDIWEGESWSEEHLENAEEQEQEQEEKEQEKEQGEGITTASNAIREVLDESVLVGLDAEMRTSVQWLLTNRLEEESESEFTFSFGDVNANGKMVTVEFKENGNDVAVTEKNKSEYVRALAQWARRDRWFAEVELISQGFFSVIPRQLLSSFSPLDLQILLSGSKQLDLEDWRVNTLYTNGYHPNHPIIVWFWKIISDMSHETRLNLLRFTTGSSAVPGGGFANLQGSDGLRRFSIQKSTTVEQLPHAHTCFNVLVIPEYKSEEELEAKLLTSIKHCDDGILLS